MDYQIAIPSYKRCNILLEASLRTLARHKADFSRLTIFTANEEQTNAYRFALQEQNLKIKLVTGVPGIGKQRIFINKYYPADTRILSLDDDIYSLHIVNDNKKLDPCDWSLDRIANKGFMACERTKARMWGINPVENGFYMERKTSVGLRYICANFFGSYAHDPVWVAPDRDDFSSGEDFESSLRSFKRYKGVIRLDGICPKTKYFAEGGIRAELGGQAERDADHTKHLIEIAKRFPKFASTYKKADGTTNIKLRPVTHTKFPWQ